MVESTFFIYFLFCAYFRHTQGLFKVKVILQPTASRPVCLGAGLPSGTHDQIVFLGLSFEVEVKLRPTVSQTLRLGVRHPSGTRDQFFFLLEIFFRQLRVCYFVAPSLTR
jgi:hypothetical protein